MPGVREPRLTSIIGRWASVIAILLAALCPALRAQPPRPSAGEIRRQQNPDGLRLQLPAQPSEKYAYSFRIVLQPAP